MQFRSQGVAEYIAEQLTAHLQAGDRVLWLVPGGSAIEVAVQVSKLLDGIDLANLTATLTDERYGMVGHADSNWHQLQQAGFILPNAQTLPVLEGQDMAATTDIYAQNLKSALAAADYKLGLFGIGPDGHTAGILPNSPAVSAEGYAVAYNASNFKRITMTSEAIRRLDEAVVYATNETKWPVLQQLESEQRAVNEQPAQLLKLIPKLTIFSDYKGHAL